ncbi:acyl-CoA dehydrogenase family protein [Pseudooceanicola sp.]|uniref:acyl-CoA dehydrogenase family protein n=1 Tax=Pseudooceanicola sp. TaxID=1914328 RepID=UPI00263845D9|nr:acyl-CoA dehydrogenase family protein [Pseudooceanicola sp.]MDF1856116.1 acyl-CoA dehydrogenase family protein [Pseudooceanicola sp.]
MVYQFVAGRATARPSRNAEKGRSKPMNAQDSQLAAFRAEAREWLAKNFPKSLTGKRDVLMDIAPRYPEGEDWAAWKTAMGDKGWGTPTWPTEYGAGGLSRQEAMILDDEIERIGAFNPIVGMGVNMLGPTLLEFGTDEQRAQHLPLVVRGAVNWCQGYSEPGAGSDLASLKTKAEDKGDHYLVNGQKIWTSGSMYADWCFCLVRTSNDHKHEGISFLLIDMHSPGVEVRPITLISGKQTFAEVFFTDVKVEKGNLVGDLRQGWTIAKRLMQHERNGIGARKVSVGELRPVHEVAKEYIGTDDQGRLSDYDLRARIARHQMWERAQRLTVARVVEESKQGPSEATSVMKNAGSVSIQTREELLMEIMGNRGIGWEGDDYLPVEIEQTRQMLQNKANSIYGGTYEIQANIISKRILGMLDHQ